MKRLSLLLLLVTAFASNSVYAQFTQSEFVKEWQRAKDYTKAYLDAMPEDGYAFKPTPEIRSFAQQMLHLSDGTYFLITNGTGKKMPLSQPNEKGVAPTKEAVTKAVMDSYDFAISTLQAMTPAQLAETIKFHSEDITRFGMIGKAFEHQTHHRGQTTVYLRLKGVTPPAEKLF
ncbi:MAG TPA: DinB family protein [Mucilaginibacter sp.]